MEKQNIVYLRIGDLTPYKNNPRKNAETVDAVAASIKEFGFRSPIIITENHEVINGHARLKAAKKLGMEEVPCVIANGLTKQQIKEYRLIDNKTSEYASWDSDLLEAELEDLDFGLDFDFDFTDNLKKRKEWEQVKKLCDLKDKVAYRKADGIYYHSLFKTGKEGKPLPEIKVEENVPFLAMTAADHIRSSLGEYLKEAGWCIVTTPRRRHKGFHFATEISRKLSKEFMIPFYEDAIICFSKHRVDPNFELKINPTERNVILYDDIITTGSTIKTSRTLLTDAGHIVYPLISIDNH